MSAKWPYEVTTQYQVDGSRTVLDFQDYYGVNGPTGEATVTSSIVASFIGSSMQSHDILISVPPGGPFAVLDRLM